jgi:hypothetical protein
MPTPSIHSPNIGNYYVGRGFLSMKLEGESTFQDMGNCTKFTFQASPTRLDHYSSRVGVRKKDLTVITQLDAKLSMSLEEATVRNMALLTLGLPLESAAASLDIMSNPLFFAALQFTATNSVGPQWNAVFPLVLITPTTPFQMIAEGSGTWGVIEVEGDVQFDSVSNQFGWLFSTSFPDV